MSEALPLTTAINSTLDILKQSEDYSDRPTIANFMILIDSIIKSPNELVELSNVQLANLALCMSCIQTSNFTRDFPSYYDWNTGKIISAVGFFAYMKQLDNSYLLNSHYPSFIVLIHDGREYLANLFLQTVLKKENRIQLTMSAARKEQIALDITKYFECLLHITCKKKGYSDENTEDWFDEIIQEIDSIKERMSSRNPFEDAKLLYRTLTRSFKEGVMPSYCKVEH